MNKNVTIAVLGGTGKAGTYLIKQLVAEGFKIRVLTRNPEKIEENIFVEKVIGNATDYKSVYALINGCNVVISTLGQTKGEDPVFSVAANNIVKVMETLQLKRYIVLTGLTLDTQFDNKGFQTMMKSMVMKLLFRKIITDKQNEYKILKSSNLNWTIVRVPFIELTNSQRAIQTSLTDCKGSSISSTDLAKFLIDQINDERFVREAPFIWNS